MGSESIKKDMQIFEASVKKLSSGISQAGSLWTDAKYSELSFAVAELAKQSRDVLVVGERCCGALDKFSQISSEKY